MASLVRGRRSAYGHLAHAWLRTARRAGADDDVASVGVRLVACYADPRRGYHDLRHLDEVLRHVDDLTPHAADPDAVRLAAWYHDAVYAGRPGEDERRSAERAATELAGLGVPAATAAEVGRLVLLTAGHRVVPGDRNGAVLCDADLAVLAADPDRYAAYVAGVRREYAHVPDTAFAAGRAEVLRGLLARDRIYHTPPARAWEPAARANVAAELAGLANG